MPQVDFYILGSDSPDARWEFVARLLNKLQKLGKTAHIAVDSTAQAGQLDTLLWAFPPESFLPHRIADGVESPSDEPFSIVASDSPASTRPADATSAPAVPVAVPDVFINLCKQPPAEHQQLQRLVEVVIQDSTILTTTRQNFRFYRDQGYPVQSHDIRL